MPGGDRARMLTRPEAVAAAPDDRHAAVLAMQGQPPGRFRLRQGDWRAIFVREGDDILVVAVGNRREANR